MNAIASPKNILRVGSRGSPLALTQVEEVFLKLKDSGQSVAHELIIYQTQGDQDKSVSLRTNSIDNFFTDCIDQALLDGEIDIAIHSAKDLPKNLAKGLKLFALTSALDETDAFVGKGKFEDLKAGAKIGTSSPLRQAAVKASYPDLETVDIRGTIKERMNLIESGVCEGIIVATCALKRLGLSQKICNIMPWDTMPLQGQLAVIGRMSEHSLEQIFSIIDVRKKYGAVTLVGAGPGDPELITLKGMKALKEADCVFYDYLVDNDLLNHAANAEKIYVGKRKGEHTLPQEELSKQLRQKSMLGQRVVRLKGGDPLIFGRGADEIEYLRSYYIPVNIVPGVSSATGLASGLGVPLTARGLSSSVAFLTAHTGKEPEGSNSSLIDIPKVDTLVFLMGLTKLKVIIQSLSKAQWDEQTPVLIISKGTRLTEKVLSGTIQTIEALVSQNQVEPPALIIVGQVVRFYEKFLIHDEPTLYVGTDPQKYQAMGPIIHAPMIEIKKAPLDEGLLRDLLDRIAEYHWIILTSRFAVQFFIKALKDFRYSPEEIMDRNIAVIGQETARALKEHHIQPTVVADPETSEGLFRSLTKRYDLKGQKILFPRSSLPNPYLKEKLREEGASIDELTIYQNVPTQKQDIPFESIKNVIFTSPSTVTNFLNHYGAIPGHWRILSKGPRTRETLKEKGYQSEVLIYD